LEEPALNAAGAVSNGNRYLIHQGNQVSRPAGDVTNAIRNETRIRRMMDIGFHDGGIHAKSAPADDLLRVEPGRHGPVDDGNAGRS
jgi:succinylarginine dihydrolase